MKDQVFITNISLLKGYATPKSRLCFCLHFRPKDDVVVSILAQGKSLFGSKNATLFVRIRRGNAHFGIQRVISLAPESKQQQNTGLCLNELRLIRSLIEGSRGIIESTS